MSEEFERKRKMEERDDYKFLKLRDAVACVNQKVNLIGVVVEFGFPKSTKGSDYFSSARIIDDSYTNQGIAVNFFAETALQLPSFTSPGDIVLLSHVVMKTHDGEVYALFNKKFSAFALYEGTHGTDFAPYHASAKLSSRELDKKFIGDLRNWLIDFQDNTDPHEFQLMSGMKAWQRHNLAGKILHISKSSKGCWIIFLWDGTDAPKSNIQSKMIDEMNNPIPLQLEPDPLPRDILCTFPPLGTILNVALNEGNKDVNIGFFRKDQWIGFINAFCEVHAGLWHGMLTPFTKFRYISSNSPYASHCTRLYEERLSSNVGRLPISCYEPLTITVVDNARGPFSSLMDVLTYAQVRAKFKCVVRVLAVLPFRVEDFLSPRGIYRIRLTLEDPTARIHAYLYDDDAEKFFDGYPSNDVLKRKMNLLLGVGENDRSNENEYTVRDPPWFVCKLKSYYLDKNDVWGSRHYRIFDTRLVSR